MSDSPFILHALDSIEQQLGKVIPELPVLYNELFTASRYSLLGSAKRLRPLLTLAATYSLDGKIEAALHPACAIEIVHTYSLIHDDLPCMDNDDMRRGKPTLHRVVSEALAVLTGDFLLTLPFEILADSPGITDLQKIRLVKSLSHAAGGHGLIGGQVLDLQKPQKAPLSQIHQLKTGSLFKVCFQFAAIIANTDSNQFNALSSLGLKVGEFFQLVDDFIDKENEVSPQKVDHFYNDIKNTLKDMSLKSSYIQELIDKIIFQIPTCKS